MTNSVGPAVAVPSFTARQAAARSALNAVVFLTALVLSCVLLRRGLPFPDVPVVRQKLSHLARYGDQYDVLFLGSSRVQFQIMPAIFDRVAGENGVAVKSFNAGVAALGSPEDAYLLEQILQRPHGRLRWVIIEPSRLRTGLNPESMMRFRYWHDTARLKLVARRLWGQAIEMQAELEQNRAATLGARYQVWSTMAGDLCGHIRYWLMCAVNLGSGFEVLDRWLRARSQSDDSGGDLGDHGDGWVSAGRNRQQIPPPALEIYQRALAERLAKPAGKDRGDEVSQSALEQLLATITEAGAVPVLVVPPTTHARNFFPTEARERELEILDFSDVRQNAELFAPEHRSDVDHINDAGAKIFSQALAQRFVKFVSGRVQTP